MMFSSLSRFWPLGMFSCRVVYPIPYEYNMAFCIMVNTLHRIYGRDVRVRTKVRSTCRPATARRLIVGAEPGGLQWTTPARRRRRREAGDAGSLVTAPGSWSGLRHARGWPDEDTRRSTSISQLL